MDPWIPILKNLRLNRAEQNILARYESAPESRMFLPTAEILRNHNLNDESLELLMQGVQNHPRYTAARVILARELFTKGMPRESWNILDATVDSLKENVLAQKIMFKLALVLGKEFEARQIYSHMHRRKMIDQELQELGDQLKSTDFNTLRTEYRHKLIEEGIPLDEELGSDKGAQVVDKLVAAEQPGPLSDMYRVDFDESYLKSLAGYQTIRLRDLAALTGDQERSPRTGASAQLDSATLAEIYEKQRFFGKALEIYKRLLDKSPHNEWLQTKVRTLGQQMHSEPFDRGDMELDSAEQERLMEVEEIDRKLKILNQLLQVLS